MKMKNKKLAGWKLFLLILALLFPASMPAMGVSAAPNSGTLTIHNYVMEDMDQVGLPNDGNELRDSDLPADAKPLVKVEFTIYQVDPDKTSEVETAADAWKYILKDTEQKGFTDANGKLTFQLEKDGLYYVAETGNQGEQKAVFCEPFLVSMPMYDQNDKLLRDIHVYPKNQALIMDNFVGEPGGADYNFNNFDAAKSKPVSKGDAFGWTILASLPVNLGMAASETYRITDSMESGLSYIKDSLKVYSVPKMNTKVKDANLLVGEGSDYTFKFDEKTATLTLELTAAGIQKLGERYKTDGDRFLLIKYDCIVNEDAPQGVSIYNGATVEYSKSLYRDSSAADKNSGFRTVSTAKQIEETITPLSTDTNGYVSASSAAVKAAVHTGQIGITKLDKETEKPLAGAEFGIAATKEDAEKGSFLDVGTTDENGTLSFEGLAYGAEGDSPSDNTANTTYWIIETKAPTGYEKVSEPVEVIFQYQQDQETGEYYFARITVYNVPDSSNYSAGSSSSSGSGSGSSQSSTGSKTGDTSPVFILSALFLFSLAAILAVYYNRKKALK